MQGGDTPLKGGHTYRLWCSAMKWILVLILFNQGLHYAQTEPTMYADYDECRVAAEKLKDTLMVTRPNASANVMTFCVALPREI